MIVLGLDTATPATAVALRTAAGVVLEAHDDPDVGERPGHVTRLLPMCEQLLARASLDWADIQRLAVGLGPGTFTGLRIGVATARGLAQSLSVELVGVSTAMALAQAGLGEPADGVLAVIDARRGEAFAGAYDASGELIAPRALAPEKLRSLLESARARVRRERWLAVGDGALRFREPLQAAGALVPEDSSPLHRVSAAAICRLAIVAPVGALERVVPEYARRPDAEIALEGAGR